MARVLINSIHDSLFVNQIRALVACGHEPVVPVDKAVFRYGRTYGELIEMPQTLWPFLRAISSTELSKGEIDVIWCGCFEHVKESARLKAELRCPIILYTPGNDIPYRKEHGDLLLAEDLETFVQSDIPLKRFIIFPPDYSYFRPNPSGERGATRIITLIRRYNVWPESYAAYKQIVESFRSRVLFIHHTDLHHPEMIQHLQQSTALLHIKPTESCGYSIMEALACGCPVLVNETLLNGRTCSLFLEPGFNCWLLRESHFEEDFAHGLEAAPRLQMNAADSIRAAVRFERTLHILDEAIWRVMRI